MNCRSFVTLLLSTVSLLTTTAFAASLDKIQFIKISPQDSKAVIKTAEGKLQVVKPGDLIAESTTIKEIVSGRIILEDNTPNGLETIIVRLDNGKIRVERLRRQPDKVPILVAPASGAPVSN